MLEGDLDRYGYGSSGVQNSLVWRHSRDYYGHLAIIQRVRVGVLQGRGNADGTRCYLLKLS